MAPRRPSGGEPELGGEFGPKSAQRRDSTALFWGGGNLAIMEREAREERESQAGQANQEYEECRKNCERIESRQSVNTRAGATKAGGVSTQRARTDV